MPVKRRRTKSTTRKVKLFRPPSGNIPDSLTVELTYADSITITSAVVGYVEHTFALNDIFDPDVTGVGHQPLGRDEFAAIYGRYRVTHAKYEVWVASNANLQQLAGCVVTRGVTALASRTEAMEHPTSQVKMLAPRNLQNGEYMSGMIALKDFDKAGSSYNDNDYGSIIGASPAKRTFLKVFCSELGAGTNPSCNFIVRITFRTKFYERNNLLQS